MQHQYGGNSTVNTKYRQNAEISQKGDYNFASQIQTGYYRNHSEISQKGDNNTATVLQSNVK